MPNKKTSKLSFCDETGKKIDIRDEDISMGIDLVKNAQNEVAKDTEMNPEDRKEMFDSYFRLWYFLVSIRAGLRPSGH